MMDYVLSRRNIHKFVSALCIGAGTLVIVCMMIIFGPALEDKYFPAFGEAKVTEINKDNPNMTTFLITTNILRPCKFVLIGAFVHSDRGWMAAEVHTPDIPKSFDILTLGTQNFGRMTIQPRGDAVKVIVTNRCHWMWENRSYYTWPKDAPQH